MKTFSKKRTGTRPNFLKREQCLVDVLGHFVHNTADKTKKTQLELFIYPSINNRRILENFGYY